MANAADIQTAWSHKIHFMKSIKGGVIFCVSDSIQASMCEKVGARALIAVDDRTPAIVTTQAAGVSRMIDPSKMKSIMDCVALPVFGRVRIGHQMEAKIVEHLKADGIEEHERLSAVTVTDVHIPKHNFKIPFICGASNLGEALRRIAEGASMIRTKGESATDTANLAAAVTEITTILSEIKTAVSKAGNETELHTYADSISAPRSYVKQVAQLGSLPVPFFACGGIVQPSDAAYMMELGCDGVIISSRIFAGTDPQRRALSMIMATENPKNYDLIARLSENLGVPPTE
ncbi:Pyridoxal 5'-phosphate synthase subunit snz1 [Coemansia spiralis]|uniref:pyridoxal 5'-phosphate synthase (glutamine hydrolyzing) n=2 Tax=Coemansia TaxID=4863 RepID=A0A9W8KWR7_9FUNG|nr:pyridoxal phosphate synthase yaaD subunit [Coemansia spiralis]KAJ1995373.1 Pyridoxal 5'-phosphate synthase subunit snz1 [Coemansia umbellata]KAJ2624800.1 Pyridoxal 5'-phosphate synthase subunit snz1 [Coemansia sp. RSA 1358]KAJ2674571.1 Pyridoxal 5'-phosphate synthase subunit snz1 [Coemansia spiralis]